MRGLCRHDSCTHRALGQRDAGVLAETMGLTKQIRSVPIDDTDPPVIGLVHPQREPLTPLTAALVAEAHRQARGGPDR